MPRIHSQLSAEYYSQPMRGLSVLGMLAEYGQGPGHIFNLGHGLQPNMNPEHVGALVAAVHELSPAYHAG